jgi:hypothetical protein
MPYVKVGSWRWKLLRAKHGVQRWVRHLTRA